MKHVLEINIETKPVPLSKSAVMAIKKVHEYDFVVFTSNRAKIYFAEVLKKYDVIKPKQSKILQVGPRIDLLGFNMKGKRILFPRSKIAPFDIVKALRKRGAVVRPIIVYTSFGSVLSSAQMRALIEGGVTMLYFKSPSGVNGLLQQIPRRSRQAIFALDALCIGKTTASYARKAGFKHVRVKTI